MPVISNRVDFRVCEDRCVVASPLLGKPALVDAASTWELGEIRPVGFPPSVVLESEQQLGTDGKCCAPARLGVSGS